MEVRTARKEKRVEDQGDPQWWYAWTTKLTKSRRERNEKERSS
jgi:hypothetical protein